MRWKALLVVMQTVVYSVRVMKQFEYKVFTRIVGIEKHLNKLGFEGWELVAVDCGQYIMKREYKM